MISVEDSDPDSPVGEYEGDWILDPELTVGVTIQ